MISKYSFCSMWIENSGWTNAKKVRMLEYKEAEALGCYDGTETCSWIHESLNKNPNQDNNSKYSDFFIAQEDKDSKLPVYPSVSDGIIFDHIQDSLDMGCRPVIQINTKYINPV